MAHQDHDGIVDCGKTYTTKALARIVGRDEEWVKVELLHMGLDYFKVGTVYFVSGHAFQLFVERNSTPCPDKAAAGSKGRRD